MKRSDGPVNHWRAGVRRWRTCCSGLPPWGAVAVLLLAAPWWGWGQSNALDKASVGVGALIRLSALHPGQLEELKGRPLCVYNFTSW